MASVEELSFKVESAKQWRKDVEAELEQVNAVLKLVKEEVETQPYEDDTIMVGLKKTGEALGKSFEILNKNFMKAVAGITDIAAEWTKTISKILSSLSEAARKIGGSGN